MTRCRFEQAWIKSQVRQPLQASGNTGKPNLCLW
uniref:Uncharacterized protein n=1 Tax=Anguilla anguilla TaxID=7936 RepID=A0A0E9SCJ0_ANGAN